MSVVFVMALISANAQAQDLEANRDTLPKGGEVSGGGTLVSGGDLPCPVVVDLLVYNPEFREDCPTNSIANPVPTEQQGKFFDRLLEAAESSADRKALESLQPGFDRFSLDALPEKWLLKQEIQEWKALLPNLETQLESLELALNSKTVMWFMKPGNIGGDPDHHIPENLNSKFKIYQFHRVATTLGVYSVFSWSALERLGPVSRKALVLHELGRIAFPGIKTSGLQKFVGALILEPRNSTGAQAVLKVASQKDVSFDSSGEYFEKIEKTFSNFLAKWNKPEIEAYFKTFSQLPRSLSNGMRFCQEFVSNPEFYFINRSQAKETDEDRLFYMDYKRFWWSVRRLWSDGITLSMDSNLSSLLSATAQLSNVFSSVIFDQILETTQDYPFSSVDIENHLLNESEGVFSVSNFQLKKLNYSSDSFVARFTRTTEARKFTLDGNGYTPIEGEWVADAGYIYVHIRHRGAKHYLLKLKISQSGSFLVFGSDIDLVGEIIDMNGQIVGKVHLDD